MYSTKQFGQPDCEKPDTHVIHNNLRGVAIAPHLQQAPDARGRISSAAGIPRVAGVGCGVVDDLEKNWREATPDPQPSADIVEGVVDRA